MPKKTIDELESKINGINLAALPTVFIEMRKLRAELQKLKHEVLEMESKGYYLRDEQRIILSAPEIVLGNVDKDGILIGNGTIVIRGTEVSLEGTDVNGTSSGKVMIRAPKIHQIAVDSGIDGHEAAIMPSSEIVSMAKDITLHSSDAVCDNDVKGCFFEKPAKHGLVLHTDDNLTIDASVNRTKRKESLTNAIGTDLAGLTKEVKDAKDALPDALKAVKDEITDYKKIKDELVKYEDINKVRTEISQIDKLNKQFEQQGRKVSLSTSSFYETLGEYLEKSREKTALTNINKDDYLKTEAKYNDESHTNVSVTADTILLKAKNGEGAYKTDAGSGIKLQACNIDLVSREEDGSLIKKDDKPIGKVTINTGNINLSTQNYKYKSTKKDNDVVMDWENAETVSTEGKITLATKELTMQATENKLENGIMKEVQLTDNSKISMRAEDIFMGTYNTGGEGKNSGSILMNSNCYNLVSYDMKMTDNGEEGISFEPVDAKKFSSDSKLVIGAQNITIGSLGDDGGTKEVIMQGSTTSIGAQNQAYFGLLKDAELSFKDGKMDLGSTENTIKGKTKIDTTEVTGELTVPKATVKELSVSGKLTSPTISDGMQPGTPSQPGKPSVSFEPKDLEKLKEIITKYEVQPNN